MFEDFVRQHWSELAAFAAGSGGTVLWDYVKERTSYPIRATISIDQIKFGFPKIELPQFAHISSDADFLRLMTSVLEIDEIFLSKSSVGELNELAKKSGILSQVIDRDYTGQELFSALSSPLHFYSKAEIWSGVSKTLASAFRSAEDGKREDFEEIYLGTMQGFLEAAGLFNWIIGSFVRSDFSMSLLEGEGEQEDLGLVSVSETPNGEFFLVFGPFYAKVNVKSYQVDLSREVLRKFCYLLNTGQGDKLGVLFDRLSENFLAEKLFVEKYIDKLNVVFALSTPKTMRVSARVHNSGRFPFIAKGEFDFFVDGERVNVSLNSAVPEVVGSGGLSDADQIEYLRGNLRPVVRVNAGDIALVQLSGRVAATEAERLKKLFDAGNAKSFAEMQVLTRGAAKTVKSRKVVFGALQV